MADTIGTRADLAVAAEIRAELARRQLTQEDVVRRLGVSRPWLSRRLSGHTALTIGDVATLANLLEIPAARLLAPLLNGTDHG